MVHKIPFVFMNQVLQPLEIFFLLNCQHLPELLRKGKLQYHPARLVLLHVQLLFLEDGVLFNLLLFLLNLVVVVVIVF